MWVWEPSLISNWDELIAGLVDCELFNSAIPITLYGHSFGSLIAFEVATRLNNKGKMIMLRHKRY